MHSNERWPDERRLLERELRTREMVRILRPMIRGGVPWDDWLEVEEWFHHPTTPESERDRVLTTLLRDGRVQRHPRCATALLLLFWRELDLIERWFRRLDPSPRALRTNVLWAFMKTARRLDPDIRGDRLLQKLRNDTTYELRRFYARERDRLDQEISFDDEGDEDVRDLAESIPGPPDAEWMAAMARIEVTWAEHVLLTLAGARVISSRDVPLLMHTVVGDETLAAWSCEVELGLEAAKKRRQRALRAIRRVPHLF